MIKALAAPKSIREAIKFFADPDFAHSFFVQLRWPDGVRCIACEFASVGFLKSRRLYQCKECRKQFGPKLGTIFEDSPISLEKWLPAIWMLCNCKNGISSYGIARSLGVTQKTGWFMLGRIRVAMKTASFGKLDGDIETDETYIGGLAKFMYNGRGSKH